MNDSSMVAAVADVTEVCEERTRDSSTLTTQVQLQEELLHGMAWMAAIPLNLSNHPTHVVLVWAAHDQLDQERQSEDSRKHAMHCGINTEFCPCNTSFVFANSEMETCWESCIIHFPTKPPCSTRVDVLETGNVPILFSLPQMKNLGMTNELDPKGDKITCQAFGLHSSPVEYSAMGHIVLDLTSLAYHPTSRERSVQPKRHVTFALTEKNPCAQFIHQGVMKMTINLLFVQIVLPILKTNMISLWCDHHHERNR